MHSPFVQAPPAGHPDAPFVQHALVAMHAAPHCFRPGRLVHLPFLQPWQSPHGFLHFFFFFFFVLASATGTASPSNPASAKPAPVRRETKRRVSVSKVWESKTNPPSSCRTCVQANELGGLCHW